MQIHAPCLPDWSERERALISTSKGGAVCWHLASAPFKVKPMWRQNKHRQIERLLIRFRYFFKSMHTFQRLFFLSVHLPGCAANRPTWVGNVQVPTVSVTMCMEVHAWTPALFTHAPCAPRSFISGTVPSVGWINLTWIPDFVHPWAKYNPHLWRTPAQVSEWPWRRHQTSDRDLLDVNCVLL